MSHTLTQKKTTSHHPRPLTPDPIQESQDMISDKDTQEGNPNPDNPNNPEDDIQTPKAPGNQSTISDETRPQIGSQISPTTTL